MSKGKDGFTKVIEVIGFVVTLVKQLEKPTVPTNVEKVAPSSGTGEKKES